LCSKVRCCLGISSEGESNLVLNQQGDWIINGSGGFSCTSLNSCSTTNLPEGSNLYFTCARVDTCLGISPGGSATLFLNEQGDWVAPSAGDFWSLTGNAGTDPNTNFIGTTDGEDFIIQPSTGSVGIGITTPSGKLHVGPSPTPFIGEWDNGLGVTGQIAFGTYSGGLNVSYTDVPSNTAVVYNLGGNLESLFIENTTSPATSSASLIREQSPTEFRVYNGDFTEILRVQDTGNVGIGTASPTSKLTIKGGQNVNVTPIDDTDSPYTVLITDYIIAADSTSGIIICTLPAAPAIGETYIIKDVVGNSLVNNITLDGNGNNIDGSATYPININYQSITIVFTGNQWSII